MKKIFFAILSIFAILPAFAIDYGQIEVEVRTHPDTYKELLDRFISSDSTLTNEQVSQVYYGFPFTPAYEPTDTFPDIHAAFERKDFNEVARLIEPALELNPVSLDLLIMGLAAYEQGAGTTPGKNALRMAIRADQLASAILESGKGTTAVSPFYIISSVDRERILKNVIGIGEITGTSTVGPIDAYKFTFPGQSRMHILYFDNTRQARYEAEHPK